MKDNYSVIKMTRKAVAGLLAAAMVVTSAGISTTADAAKKPKLSNKNLSINVGSSKTIKLKNSTKSAKVTWKSSKTKIVKITKKKSGKNASATVKGLTAGKSTVTASIKLGSSKSKLKCIVKVTNKVPKTTASPAPSATAVPTAVPTAVTTTAPTATAVTVSTTAPTAAPSSTTEPTAAPSADDIWVATWGTAEEKCDTTANAMPQMALEDSTVRQILRVTTSGTKIKLKLSNQYSTQPVEVKSMHLAKQVEATKSDIDTSTDTIVTVDGQEEFTIPAKSIIETDAIDFDVTALENVAVSMYFGSTPTNNITGHRGARATTYQMAGDNVSAEKFSDYKTTTSWFFLADVSLMQPAGSKAIVCFGDSITDGYGTDASYLKDLDGNTRRPDSYTRWEDYFAKRLQANDKTKNISVINEGIGANAMFGSYPTDAGKDRFSRDLLEHDGVAYCIILFGVNDLNKLSDTSKFNQLKPEYEKMIALCHENNIKVYAAPILPFGTSDYYSEASEETRQLINNWFRSDESNVDGIIDFDKAVADPANPTNVLEKYTTGDGLHPYNGYDVMADAIDLTLFE